MITILIIGVIVLFLTSTILIYSQSTTNKRRTTIRKIDLNRDYLINKMIGFNQLLDKMIPENIENKSLVDELTKLKNTISVESNDIEVSINKSNEIFEMMNNTVLNDENNKITKDEIEKLYNQGYTEELKVERINFNQSAEKFNNQIVSFPGSIVNKVLTLKKITIFSDVVEDVKVKVKNSASHYNTEFNINQETITSPTPVEEKELNLYNANKVKPTKSEVKFETKEEITNSNEMLTINPEINQQNVEIENKTELEQINSTPEQNAEVATPIEEMNMPIIEPTATQTQEITPQQNQPLSVAPQVIVESIPNTQPEQITPSVMDSTVEKNLIPEVKEELVPDVNKEALQVEIPSVEPFVQNETGATTQESNQESIETIENIEVNPNLQINSEQTIDIQASQLMVEDNIINNTSIQTEPIVEQGLEPKPVVEITQEKKSVENTDQSLTNKFCPQCNTITELEYCPNCGTPTE